LTGSRERSLRAVRSEALPLSGGQPVVYLHVGEPKTGTTFLQQVMWRNRSALAQFGIMLPGPRPLAHWRAAQDLREVPQAATDPLGPFTGAWDRLARQALRAPLASVVSHELFAAANAEQVERAVASFASTEVHLVVTVRDMATLLPAEWQESVKHRNARAWEDWLSDVIDHEAGTPDRRRWWFWQVHDTLEILRLWSAHVPPQRVHVITMPPRGGPRELLWQRFAEVIGVDPSAVDTTLARSNESLGLPEIELIRRVNQALPEEVPGWFYMRTVKDLLAHQALAGRPTVGRLELPAERDAWAREQGELLIAGLRHSGYHLVGDLEDLLPRPITGRRDRPGDVTTEQLLDAGLGAITALLTDRAASEGMRLPDADPETAPKTSEPTVKAALIALSRRSPAVHRMRRGYWHTVNTARRIRAATRPAGEP
jgi:hypothetical protein